MMTTNQARITITKVQAYALIFRAPMDLRDSEDSDDNAKKSGLLIAFLASECYAGARPPKSELEMTNPCEEKAKLVSNYENAAKTFAAAVSELQSRTGTSSKTEYEELLRSIDKERLKSEQARIALEQHVAVHGC